LAAEFEMMDMGELKHFLGIHVKQDWEQGTLTLSQEAYLASVLDRFGMLDSNPVATPLTTGTKLLKSGDDDEKVDQKLYQSMVGSTIYGMLCTRPDIAFAVQQISQFSSNPSTTHLQVAKRILRYLKGTISNGITYRRSSGSQDPIVRYCDSDFANGEDRKSIAGDVFLLAGGAIGWKSKK
jgi:hypothetical protein